jgi:hypothetical protein
VKHGVLKPLDITIVIAVLLVARPVLSFMQRRKARAAQLTPLTR